MTIIKRLSSLLLLALVLTVPFQAAANHTAPFPEYGQGALELRLYSSYFCPPCGALEPQLEPFFTALQDQGNLRLILVDFPASRPDLLYIEYFLYALKAENTLARALDIKKVLFEAAGTRELLSEADLKALFADNNIAYVPFDTRVLHPRFNELLQEDQVRSTPTLVVIDEQKRQVYTGGKNILEALERLVGERSCSAGEAPETPENQP